jgi:HD-like signal output (HDOD) protein
MGVMIKEIGAKHVVQLVVSQMLQIDEEREKIYTRQAASQDVQLAQSIHGLLEVMGSTKNAKEKR